MRIENADAIICRLCLIEQPCKIGDAMRQGSAVHRRTDLRSNLPAVFLYLDGSYCNRFLLCYDDRIVVIDFDWSPTPEQMAIVGEKLGG